MDEERVNNFIRSIVRLAKKSNPRLAKQIQTKARELRKAERDEEDFTDSLNWGN